MVKDIVESPIGEVGNIDDNTEAFHFRKKSESLFGETGHIRFAIDCWSSFIIIWSADAVKMVPGKCYHANAKTMEISQNADVALTDFTFFQRQKGGHQTLAHVVHNIFVSCNRANQICVFCHLFMKYIDHMESGNKRIRVGLHIDKKREVLKKISGIFHFM